MFSGFQPNGFQGNGFQIIPLTGVGPLQIMIDYIISFRRRRRP